MLSDLIVGFQSEDGCTYCRHCTGDRIVDAREPIGILMPEPLWQSEKQEWPEGAQCAECGEPLFLDHRLPWVEY